MLTAAPASMTPLFGRTQYLRGAVVFTLKHTLLSEGFFSLRLVVTTSVKGPEDKAKWVIISVSQYTRSLAAPKNENNNIKATKIISKPNFSLRKHKAAQSFSLTGMSWLWLSTELAFEETSWTSCTTMGLKASLRSKNLQIYNNLSGLAAFRRQDNVGYGPCLGWNCRNEWIPMFHVIPGRQIGWLQWCGATVQKEGWKDWVKKYCRAVTQLEPHN